MQFPEFFLIFSNEFSGNLIINTPLVSPFLIFKTKNDSATFYSITVSKILLQNSIKVICKVWVFELQ